MGLASVVLALAGAGNVAVGHRETVEISRQHRRWMGGPVSAEMQARNRWSLLGAGGVLAVMGLVLGVHHLQTRPRREPRPEEMPEDPDFAGKP